MAKRGRKQYPATARAVELVRGGMSRSAAAREVGITPSGVSVACARAGLPAGVKGRKTDANTDRDERMASMYRQGLTLQIIGDHFGVTRQRVEQIIGPLRIGRANGGAQMRGAAKKQARQDRLNAASIIRWGMNYAEAREHRHSGVLRVFESQRNLAKQRGIKWSLTFAQWHGLWVASGKLEQRGRNKGQYVMSRIKDEGGYVIGNVHIQTCDENGREAVKQWLGKPPKEHRGVYCLFPGTPRPYVARVGKVQVARCATAQEAASLRAEYVDSLKAAQSSRVSADPVVASSVVHAPDGLFFVQNSQP